LLHRAGSLGANTSAKKQESRHARLTTFNTIEEFGPETKNRALSLTHKYNQLDNVTKDALNHAFLLNLRGNSKQLTVADAVKEFYGREQPAKQRIINRIFPKARSNNASDHKKRSNSKKSQQSKASGDSQNKVIAHSKLFSAKAGFGLAAFHGQKTDRLGLNANKSHILPQVVSTEAQPPRKRRISPSFQGTRFGSNEKKQSSQMKLAWLGGSSRALKTA